MSQGGYVTLVGFVAQEPNLRTTKNGKTVTDVRVGTTPRFRDRATGEWRDGETSYYTVSCWQRLADHARASLHKGDPVLVKGRFKTRSFEDKTGQLRTVIEITADTVGHDLTRGIANYIRPRHQHVNTEGDQTRDRGVDHGDDYGDDYESDQDPETSDLSEGAPMIDEEAIERFGRDLDAGLSEAELAARALEDDETAKAAVPPAPPVPY